MGAVDGGLCVRRLQGNGRGDEPDSLRCARWNDFLLAYDNDRGENENDLTEYDTFLIASDGWYEGATAPPEPPDTASFGWLNWLPTEGITGPGISTAGRTSIYTFMYRIARD